MQVYKIAEMYTDAPGGRFIKDGPFSGEHFRETVLIPKINALPESERLLIDFDGAFGYPKSFLEEAFGGLARVQGARRVIEVLRFKSDDEPDIINKVVRYINDAQK